MLLSGRAPGLFRREERLSGGSFRVRLRMGRAGAAADGPAGRRAPGLHHGARKRGRVRRRGEAGRGAGDPQGSRARARLRAQRLPHGYGARRHSGRDRRGRLPLPHCVDEHRRLLRQHAPGLHGRDVLPRRADAPDGKQVRGAVGQLGGPFAGRWSRRFGSTPCCPCWTRRACSALAARG